MRPAFQPLWGAGQNLWVWRLGSIFWASMPSWSADIYPAVGPALKNCWIYPKCKSPSWTKRCKLQISHRITGTAPSLHAVSGLWESEGGQGHRGQESVYLKGLTETGTEGRRNRWKKWDSSPVNIAYSSHTLRPIWCSPKYQGYWVLNNMAKTHCSWYDLITEITVKLNIFLKIHLEKDTAWSCSQR